MQNSSQPKLIQTPFADNGARQNIPNDSQIGITAGRASYSDGFPPLTRTPLAAGGVPPFGTDFNGVLNEITAAIRWSQAGSGYPFNAAFSTAISGYPKGAKIPNSTFDGFWLNTVEGNATNPENTTSALTGWVPVSSYGSTTFSGLSASSITATTLQASKVRILLSGTLTTNINLVLPAWQMQWSVTNDCAGPYGVTVKTPSGSGVYIPNGTRALVQGDGTNIVLFNSPGSLINVQAFYNSGTYIPTIGTRKIIVEMVGGGGGGAGSRAASSGNLSIGGSGGAGSYLKATYTSGFSGVQITVGAGGNGGTNSDPFASTGSSSSFGSLCSASGGSAGSPAGPSNTFPFTTVASVVSGGSTGSGIIIGTPGSGTGASVAISSTTLISFPGGNSQFGSGGFITATNSAGIQGSGYGAGGGPTSVSGGNPAVAGGKGSNGIVLIWEYA